MKKIVSNIIVFLTIFIIFFEVFQGFTPSVFNLRLFTKDIKNKIKYDGLISNDTLFFNPKGEKILMRKNNIGYYSHSDFLNNFSSEDFAIIGDSFVESKVCGTYNSISFLLDEFVDQKVYNFGVSGGNINDYYNIYDKYNLKKLKRVFIILTGTNDLIYKEGVQKTLHKSGSKIYNLISQRIKGEKKYLTPNYKLIRKKRDNIVYILHDNLKSDNLLRNNIYNETLEINLDKKFKFYDGHYNREGNLIVAKMILNFIDEID